MEIEIEGLPSEVSKKGILFLFGPDYGHLIQRIEEFGDNGYEKRVFVSFTEPIVAKQALEYASRCHPNMHLVPRPQQQEYLSGKTRTQEYPTGSPQNLQELNSMSSLYVADQQKSLFRYDFRDEAQWPTPPKPVVQQPQKPWDLFGDSQWSRWKEPSEYPRYLQIPMKYDSPQQQPQQPPLQRRHYGDNPFISPPRSKKKLNFNNIEEQEPMDWIGVIQAPQQKKETSTNSFIQAREQKLKELREQQAHATVQKPKYLDISLELVKLVRQLKVKYPRVTVDLLGKLYFNLYGESFKAKQGISLEKYITENDRTFTYNFNSGLIGLCDEKGCFKEEDFVMVFQEIVYRLGGAREFIKLAKVGEEFLDQHGKPFKTYGRSMRTFFQDHQNEFVWNDDQLGSEQVRLKFIPQHLKGVPTTGRSLHLTHFKDLAKKRFVRK